MKTASVSNTCAVDVYSLHCVSVASSAVISKHMIMFANGYWNKFYLFSGKLNKMYNWSIILVTAE